MVLVHVNIRRYIVRDTCSECNRVAVFSKRSVLKYEYYKQDSWEAG
jgi:hypothetical protein